MPPSVPNRRSSELPELPMETEVRTDDPGPRARSAAADPDRNVDEVEWHLGRASAYAGLTTHMGARFLAAEDAVRGIMSAVRDRGLLVLDASADATSTVPRVAADLGVPFAVDRKSTRLNSSH